MSKTIILEKVKATEKREGVERDGFSSLADQTALHAGGLVNQSGGCLGGLADQAAVRVDRNRAGGRAGIGGGDYLRARCGPDPGAGNRPVDPPHRLDSSAGGLGYRKAAIALATRRR